MMSRHKNGGKVTKVSNAMQTKAKNPPMVSARPMGHKKRNAITGSMPGWKAPKKANERLCD